MMKRTPSSLFKSKNNNSNSNNSQNTSNNEPVKIDPLLQPDPLTNITVKSEQEDYNINKKDLIINNDVEVIVPQTIVKEQKEPPQEPTVQEIILVKNASIKSTETVSPKRKPYTVYRIEVETTNTKTTLPLNSTTSTAVSTTENRFYCIYRRYSEFLDFDLKLHAEFPLSKIPFPPKKTFGKMNNEFIVQRKEDLQKFLLALIKSLPSEPLVLQFFSQTSFDISHHEENQFNGHQHHLNNHKDSNGINILSNSNSNNNNHSNGKVKSHILTSSDQITRFIISTLPFLSKLLDVSSLLALTETCSYLLNTISNYPDAWKDLYLEYSQILHYDQSFVLCNCNSPSNNMRSNSFSSGSNNSNHSSSSSPYQQQQNGNSNQRITIGNRSYSSTSLNNSISPTGSTSNLPTLSDSVDNNVKTHRSTPSNGNMTLSSSLLPSMPSGGKDDYTRSSYLQLLSTHCKIRNSFESHNYHQFCSCLALKFRGTIIGIDNISNHLTFLNQFNTEFNNISNNQNNNNNNNQNNLNNSPNESNLNNIITNNLSADDRYKISHVVAPNKKLICLQLFGIQVDDEIERKYHLSMSHFVIVSFSLVDRVSYNNINNWVDKVRLVCPEVPIILVGLERNKRESAEPNESVTYQEGLESSKNISNCCGYIESPSASDGVGGWRKSLLSEIATHLCNHYKNIFTKEIKRSKYEVMTSFLSKLFTKYSNEHLYKSISNLDGDLDKAIESLAIDYYNYIPPSNTGNGTSISEQIQRMKRSQSTSNTLPSSFHSRTPSFGDSRNLTTSGSNLRQSWNTEPSNTTTTTINDYVSNDSRSPPLIQASSHRKVQESQIQQLVERLKKKEVDSFCKAFLKKKNQTQDQQSEIILSFLKEMQIQLQSNQIFNNNNSNNNNNNNGEENEDQTEHPLSEIENHLYQNVYKSVFSSCESLERDAKISDLTGKLVFVEPQHLEISPSHWNQDLWMAAQQELLNVNDLYSPSQKLECILNCCKIILYLLGSTDSLVGADDFLPHLIYVVIHANVPNLFSNFEFTSKFVNQELLKMDRHYYFITFGIAITFIESIQAKHLKMDPEEYNAYMSGKKAYKPNLASNSNIDHSKAKIMQKLGIDEKTATNFVISSPKKNNHVVVINDSDGGSEDHDNNNNILNKLDESNQKDNSNQSTINVKKSESVPIFNDNQNQPLLPWINSESPGTSGNSQQGNKRNSLRLTRPPPQTTGLSPTDSKLKPVNEHPLNTT